MKHDHDFQFTVAALVLLGLTSGCRELAGPPGETTPPVATTSRVERVVAAPPVRKTLVVTTSQPARIEAFEETPLHAKLAG